MRRQFQKLPLSSRFILKKGEAVQKIILLFMIACHFFAPRSEAFERFPVVLTNEVQEMLELRSKGEMDFILLNTLDEIIYRHKSIPGSINIPWNVIDSRYAELGEDKKRLIVTYCIGHR